jgi:hypothetical protein
MICLDKQHENISRAKSFTDSLPQHKNTSKCWVFKIDSYTIFWVDLCSLMAYFPDCFSKLLYYAMSSLVYTSITEYYTEVHLHCFLRKRYSSWFVIQQAPLTEAVTPLNMCYFEYFQGVTSSVYGTCNLVYPGSFLLGRGKKTLVDAGHVLC